VNVLKFNLLNRPFTLLDNKTDRYLLIGIVFLFYVVFLNVYEPFNIARWYSDSGLSLPLFFLLHNFRYAAFLKFNILPLKPGFSGWQSK
jgi:hypothetical protein